MIVQSDVDLMLDCKFVEGSEATEVIHVVRFTANGASYFNVVRRGRVCVALGWGEVVEQLIELMHPKIKGEKYQMRTREQHFAEHARHAARMAENAAAREAQNGK